MDPTTVLFGVSCRRRAVLVDREGCAQEEKGNGGDPRIRISEPFSPMFVLHHQVRRTITSRVYDGCPGVSVL